MNRSIRRLVIIVTAALVCAVGLYVVPKKPLPVIAPQDVEWAADAGDYRKAYRLLERLAENGNIKSQSFLAFVLYEGEWGVAVDDARAKEWMEKAYAKNDPYARFYVAMINEPVDGKEPVLDSYQIRSPDWKADVAIAAEGGIPYAQGLMGDWAKEQQRYDDAIEWYRRAVERDRDYYAVKYYLALSLYTRPKKFRLEEIEARVSSGNPEAYAALHSAYAFAIGTQRDYRKAFMYGVISGMFHLNPSAKASMLIAENVSKSEMRGLVGPGSDLFGTWVDDKTSYIHQAVNWCLTSNHVELKCITSAVENHRLCETGYAMWHFEAFTNFLAYKACRKSLYE